MLDAIILFFNQVKRCTFDCSQTNGIGSVIVQFPGEVGRIFDDKDCDDNADSVQDSDGCSSRPSSGDSNHMRWKRKTVGSFSHAVSADTLHRGRWASLVGSICYVDDTLWIGRRCGDIVVVNVARNHNAFGHVVAVLCSEYMPGYGSGRIERLLSVGGDSVLSFWAVDDGDRGDAEDEVTRVEVWQACGVERLHRLANLVNSHCVADVPVEATTM